jgi:hypothetical protein
VHACICPHGITLGVLKAGIVLKFLLYIYVGYHTCKITLPVIPLMVPVTLPIPVMSDARTGIVRPFILRPF